jgi:hypothetical protein
MADGPAIVGDVAIRDEVEEVGLVEDVLIAEADDDG